MSDDPKSNNTPKRQKKDDWKEDLLRDLERHEANERSASASPSREDVVLGTARDEFKNAQTFSVIVNKRDGGWWVKPFIERHTGFNPPSCVRCNHANDLRAERIMLRLGGCEHVICDFCVKALYEDTSIDDFDSSDIVDPLYPGGRGKRKTPIQLDKKKKASAGKWCPSCKGPLEDFLHLELNGLKMITAPIPVARLGKKPIYSYSLAQAVEPIYGKYIKPYVDAYHMCQREYDKEAKKLQTSKESPMVKDQRQTRCYLLHKLSLWLQDRKHVFRFALFKNSMFPQELLDANTTYYRIHLDKTALKKELDKIPNSYPGFENN